MARSSTSSTDETIRRVRDFSVSEDVLNCEETRKSGLILRYAHESAESLVQAFEIIRSQRGAPRGATTDEEQDLLRSMVVICGAGLDSMMKQLIRDCLPGLIGQEGLVSEEFRKYVERRLRATDGEGDGESPHRLLARALTSGDPRSELIEGYVQHLTGGSLQSVEELSRVLGALGLGSIRVDRDKMKTIFTARNQIVHEMDIDFDAARRNRRTRRMDHMIGWAKELLELSERVLRATYQQLH